MRFLLKIGLVVLCYFFFAKTAVFASTIDMANTSNWNIRFDGPSVSSYVAHGSIQTADLYGTGNQDIIIAAPGASYNGNAYSGSIYIIANSLYTQIIGSGNTLNLADSSSYTLRIDGPVANPSYNKGLGVFGAIKVGDVNSDGRPDLAISAQGADYNSLTDSGSVYVLYNDLIRTHTTNTTGNTMYLAHTDSGGNFDQFNLRFDGPTPNSPVQGDVLTVTGFGLYIGIGSITGDGNDLVLTARTTGFNNYATGSDYLISKSLLASWSGVGNTIDTNISSNYTLRIDGPHAYNADFGIYTSQALGDLDNDGKDELVIGVTNNDNSKIWPNEIGGIYILYGSNLTSYMTGVGNNIDLGNSTPVYDTLLQTGVGGDTFGNYGPYTITDLNNDGNMSLVIVGGLYASSHGRTRNGSVYVIPYSILRNYRTLGSVVNLSDSSNYYLRLDGAGDQHFLGDMFTTVQDYFGTGKKDLITGGAKMPSTSTGTNGPSDWGWVYVISNSILMNQPASSGNVLDMALPTSYSLLYQGAPRAADATKGTHLVAPMTDNPVDVDLNGDGTHDSLFAAHYADFTNGTKSGALYVVFNFPHTISIRESSRNSNVVTLKGVVEAPSSVTNISGVEYRVDSDNPEIGWTSCGANDGGFNSKGEEFTCIVPNIPEGEGSHAIYVRAYDSNHSHTAKSHYATHRYSVDPVSHTYQIPYQNNPAPIGLFVTSIPLDNTSHESLPFTHIEPGTFNFNAFLSTEVLDPKNLPSTVKLPSSYSPIGSVFNLWYKAYHPTDWTSNAARIIPSLQLKPSTITLRYTTSDLKSFSPSSLKLAYSPDGTSWKLFSSSIVDPTNHTVSVIERVGGYYLIVRRSSPNLTSSTTVSSPAPSPLTPVQEILEKPESSVSPTPKSTRHCLWFICWGK